MEILELIIEGVKYAVPALIVYLTVRYLNESNIKRQEVNQRLLLRDELLKHQLPLRISAHERAVLFLERISPQQLLMRLTPMEKTVGYYHAELLREVQSEFEHNLAQQIFLSNHSWNALLQAKEEVIAILHTSKEGLDPRANALELSKKLIEMYSKLEKFKTQIAINELKRDMRTMFKV